MGLVCWCQMGGCFRAPKSWFLGTLERLCCPPQLLSVVMLMAAAAGLFRAPLISEFLQGKFSDGAHLPPAQLFAGLHTYPQTGPCFSLHRGGSGWEWACFDVSACAAAGTKSSLQIRQHGGLKEVFLLWWEWPSYWDTGCNGRWRKKAKDFSVTNT